MIDIINKLLGVEDNINKILDGNPDNKKDSLEQVISLISIEINNKINIIADYEISRIKQKILFEKNKRLEDINIKANNFILEMRKEFDNNKDEWIKDILNKILEDS